MGYTRRTGNSVSRTVRVLTTLKCLAPTETVFFFFCRVIVFAAMTLFHLQGQQIRRGTFSRNFYFGNCKCFIFFFIFQKLSFSKDVDMMSSISK